MPVPDDALVLDVGSGDKPSWRADVLLDRYTGAEHAAQRSGRSRGPDQPAALRRRRRGHAVRRRCLRLRDLLQPARARHRPGGRRRRAHPGGPGGLHRGAGGGQREDRRLPEPPVVVPLDEADAAGPTLVFTAKSAPYFDAEIDAYIERAGVRRALDAVLNSKFEHRVIQLHWTGRCGFASRASSTRTSWPRRWPRRGTSGPGRRWWSSAHRRADRRRDAGAGRPDAFNAWSSRSSTRPGDPLLERRIYRLGEGR